MVWCVVAAVAAAAAAVTAVTTYAVVSSIQHHDEPVTTTTTIPTTIRTTIPTTDNGKDPIDLNMCRVADCGRTGPNYAENRIVKGRYAKLDEFPYHVTFSDRSPSSAFCGGSMVNDRWIITAAHCLWGDNASDIIVSVGITNVSEISNNAIPIEGYWLHPKYEDDKEFYDIALVKTSRSIKSGSKNFVNPICLPFTDVQSTDATVVGFGQTKEIGTGSEILKTTKLSILEDSACDSFTSWRPKSMICAGDLAENSDTCYGDSGGSLAVINVTGSYVLKGITSFGNGCGRPKTPGVYTKVSVYMDWTCETMVNNGLN